MANKETVKETVEQKPFDKNSYLNELVPFRAFKDGDKYKDDISVTVNGETCLIQRGKSVMIKRKFYNVIMQSEAQDLSTAEMMNAYEDEYRAREKAGLI